MRVTNHLDAEIGRRLRQARLVENLTQDGLAQKLSISFILYHRLIKNTSGSEEDKAFKVSEHVINRDTYINFL